MESIREKIESFLNATLTDLVQSYDKHGRRASGQFEKDLEYKIEEKKMHGGTNLPDGRTRIGWLSTTGYNIQILGSPHSRYMEQGRKPGKFPPIKAIYNWIEQKGIIPYDDISKKSLAFLIARKIAREGYAGKSVINDVLDDHWFAELEKVIGYHFAIELKGELLEDLKKLSIDYD